MPTKKVNEPLRWTVEEYTNLYQSSRYLSNDVRRTLGLLIPVEVYLQDPSVSEQARLDPDPRISARAEWDPIRAIDIPCEPDLRHGPTSARISVIDFDPQTGRREDPAEWDPDLRRFYVLRKREKIYLSREHADLPQFHQVNVWAVVQSVLGMYEQETILGRPLAWAFEGNRLRLRPHVGEMENAMYDRDSRSISFGAFDRAGKRVFTCLSHDLIAHETGHAVLDGLRPYFSEIPPSRRPPFTNSRLTSPPSWQPSLTTNCASRPYRNPRATCSTIRSFRGWRRSLAIIRTAAPTCAVPRMRAARPM